MKNPIWLVYLSFLEPRPSASSLASLGEQVIPPAPPRVCFLGGAPTHPEAQPKPVPKSAVSLHWQLLADQIAINQNFWERI